MCFPRTIAGCQEHQAYDPVSCTIKNIRLDQLEARVLVLVFYPLDFTFVCPTELNMISDRSKEFEDRDAVVLFVSTDSPYAHQQWAQTPRDKGGVQGVKWTMVSDMKRELSGHLGLFDEEKGTVRRATVIVGRSLEIKHLSMNHDPIGRSVTEILRLVDAIIFNEDNGEICPAEWTN
jgi:alkyl hydroperoxide reductase subunit AhpC